jgi:hypothetical protein
MKRTAPILFLCLSIFTMVVPKASGQSKPAQPRTEAELGTQTRVQAAEDVASPASKPSNKRASDSDAAKIKSRVAAFGIGARVTVVLKNRNEYYGGIFQISDESFQIAEVDLKQQITVPYGDVKKIINGFGNPNRFNGKRWHPAWHVIALVATAGLALILITLAVPRT